MTITLTASLRKNKGTKARAEGFLPAVVYGAGAEPQSLSLSHAEFLKIYRQAGESTLIDLLVDSQPSGKALIQDVQLDPVSDSIIHVDLRRIDMTKPITAPVPLLFTGEAPIIKSSGGTLVTNTATVEVKCLPKDLVARLEVSLAGLVSYENVIKIKDIQLPAGVEIVNPRADDLVVKAAPAMTEEEIKALEAASTTAVDLNAIELAGKKKPEEGEAAEGEAAAAAEAPAKAEEKK